MQLKFDGTESKTSGVHAAYTIFLSENLKTRDEVVTFRLEDRKIDLYY